MSNYSVFTNLEIDFPAHKRELNLNIAEGFDSWFFTALSLKLHKPLLIVVNDGYEQARIYEELSSFAPSLRIYSFPDLEILPYERINPQKEVISERLKILWKTALKQVDILILHAVILTQVLPPQEFFFNKIVSFKVNDQLNIDALRTQLINSHYVQVAKVYETGEFAVRGGIIDIKIGLPNQLLRIELFDNEIESIKILDAKTNELIEELKQYEILPAHEYPTDPVSIATFTQKFNERFKNVDSDIVKGLKHNILPPGSQFYLPLFYENTSNLTNYIDDSWYIVYYSSLNNYLTQNWQEISKRYEHFAPHYPCLRPSEIFLTVEEVFSSFKKHKVVQITSQGESLSFYKSLPHIAVNNKQNQNPFINLTNFIKEFKGTTVIATPSLGRLEIIRNTLNRHKIDAQIINSQEFGKLDSTINSSKKDKILLCKLNLSQGFIYKNIAIITEQELYPSVKFQTQKVTFKTSPVNPENSIKDLAEIKVGDYLVHLNHGIGKYLGLHTQTINEIEYEMLELEYQDAAKLFIPIHNLHLISRYSSIDSVTVELSTLGSSKWQKIKERVQKKIEDLATELLEAYAKREMEKGIRFTIPQEYADFANSFGYEPTLDQQKSFEEILKDMQSDLPMDRLICGDVGFGKTEVAMRAAFICALNGYQTALLTPTTLLTEQHFQNFVNRFAGFAVEIAEISRFKSQAEIKETLEKVKLGQIDILIGTHRLLQDDIKFNKLGLIIIDEEHRFGVKQKEKLKAMKKNVNCLAMTATPIPRTLSMALEGLRSFSIIATPPKRRLPIRTIICEENNEIIKEAIFREIRRGGQVFFLYNNVENIERMQRFLLNLIPELKIAIAHGQMSEHILETTIRDFIYKKYNILLCSTIIETGIDIPNTNTILIYDAHKLGLAQLHQLRGRVGRSHHQAYCYLITPPQVNRDAEKRLDAIAATSELGGGFNLAIHDLEIRGAGEILGDQQWGEIKGVGVSLYTELLKKAIKKLKNLDDKSKDIDESLNCDVNLNTTTILPNNYCSNIHERLIYYKQLARATTIDEINEIYQNIMDNYGLPPESVKYLIEKQYLRIKAIPLGIQKIDLGNANIILSFIDRPPLEPTTLIKVMQKLKTCRHDSKNRLIWMVKSNTPNEKITNCNFILDSLCH